MEAQLVEVDPTEVKVMVKLAGVVGNENYVKLLHLATTYEQQVEGITVNTDEDEKRAVDALAAVKNAYKIAEELRVSHVKFPTRYVAEVNKVFKTLKDSFVSTRGKVERKIQGFRRQREREVEAAKKEAELRQKAAEGDVGQVCASCLSLVVPQDQSGEVCFTFNDGQVTKIQDPYNYTCGKWAARDLLDRALPAAGAPGEAVEVPMGPPEPPETPPNVTKTESGATAHEREVWDFEVKDFGKFVRAVGSNTHPELVPEDLLEIKRGEVLKIIRREEEPVRKIAGLKITKTKKLV